MPATSASPDLLNALTGYVPATGIETGVAAFVDWHRRFYGRVVLPRRAGEGPDALLAFPSKPALTAGAEHSISAPDPLAGPYGGTGRRVRLKNRIPQGVSVRFRLRGTIFSKIFK